HVVLFFVQAADGIRGFHVTGVQTCALPIYVQAEVVGGLSKVLLTASPRRVIARHGGEGRGCVTSRLLRELEQFRRVAVQLVREAQVVREHRIPARFETLDTVTEIKDEDVLVLSLGVNLIEAVSSSRQSGQRLGGSTSARS